MRGLWLFSVMQRACAQGSGSYLRKTQRRLSALSSRRSNGLGCEHDRTQTFRLVGGTDEALPKAAKSRRRQAAVEVDDKPEDREPGYRDRATVKREIDQHIAARKAYQQGVSWIAAAEAENLPVANIEAAREDLRQLHAEMVEASRQLVIVIRPTSRRCAI